MIILPCMKRPDLDAVGGSIAFAEYLQRAEGKQAKVWLSDQPDGEAQFYIDKFNLVDFATLEEVKQTNEFQLVDLSRAEALPDFIDRRAVSKVIDHRFLHDATGDFPNAIIELESVGAAATQITEYFIRAEMVPSVLAATLLYGAIYSNTLCLQGNITTQRDLDAASWLKKIAPTCDLYCSAQLEARKKDITDNIAASVSLERKTFMLNSGIYGFTQYELINGQEFWETNKSVLIKLLDEQPERSLLSIIDLSRNVSIIYVNDHDLMKHVENSFNQQVTEGLIFLKPALMRKQIAKILEDNVSALDVV